MAFAIIVPLLEITFSRGIFFFPPTLLPVVSVGILGFLGIFTLWMAYVLFRKWNIQCGCFGTASTSVGIQGIGRNLTLLALGVAGLVLSLHVSGVLPAFSFWTVVTVVSLDGCLTFLQAFLCARPVLALSFSLVSRCFLGQETFLYRYSGTWLLWISS